MGHKLWISSIASSVPILVACHGGDPETIVPSVPLSTLEVRAAEATVPVEVPLAARSGSSLRGKATFAELEGGGVRVVVDVADVSPGKHAVHVHEKGDCSAPDATSAGDHFNPEGHPHGLPGREPRHLGDFGNMDVKEDGTGHLEAVAPHANLRPGDALSFLERSIVVHAKPDDGSQPSGAAGGRIGCGEIRRKGG